MKRNKTILMSSLFNPDALPGAEPMLFYNIGKRREWNEARLIFAMAKLRLEWRRDLQRNPRPWLMLNWEGSFFKALRKGESQAAFDAGTVVRIARERFPEALFTLYGIISNKFPVNDTMVAALNECDWLSPSFYDHWKGDLNSTADTLLRVARGRPVMCGLMLRNRTHESSSGTPPYGLHPIDELVSAFHPVVKKLDGVYWWNREHYGLAIHGDIFNGGGHETPGHAVLQSEQVRQYEARTNYVNQLLLATDIQSPAGESMTA